MAERKSNWSNLDIAYAWKNSGGQLDYGNNPIGTARCPYKYCENPNILMYANKRGDNNDWDWDIDHKRSLDDGGSNSHDNLQAMHHICNLKKH